MAYFYGILKGDSKKEITRCGTRKSGIKSIIACEGGIGIEVEIKHDDIRNDDFIRIKYIPWNFKEQSNIEETIIFEESVKKIKEIF